MRLLLLAAAAFASGATGQALPAFSDPSRCALYCFIVPEKSEKVDFTLYSNLTQCTHFVYGFGELLSDLQFIGPSVHDEPTHSYAGNLYHLRALRTALPNAAILLGLRINQRESVISWPSTRQALVRALAGTVEQLYLDGLFLHVDRTIVDSQRFGQFVEELADLGKPVVLGVPLSLVTSSHSQLVEAEPHVAAIFLMSKPTLRKIVLVDPLLPQADTPPELTISFNAQLLAEKGVPKRKIIIGLTTGAVVYNNYLEDTLKSEAEGSVASLQATCAMRGTKSLDIATASQLVRSEAAVLSSNGPEERSVGRKARWITSAGFGGIGLQSLQNDDPKGKCKLSNGQSFPLLRLAAANSYCMERANEAHGCTRMCYVNSARPLHQLPRHACSHVLVETTLSALGEVRLTKNAESSAHWLRSSMERAKPLLMLSIGPNQSRDVWRLALYNDFYRRAVVKQLQALLTEWKAAGVEVSWTHDPIEGPIDTMLLAKFLAELRIALGSRTTIMLAASPASTYTNQYGNIKTLNTTVDKVVLHTHRFHDTRQPRTGHHSPLFIRSPLLADARYTVEGMVAEWAVHLRMPRSKIVVGITAEPLSMHLADGNEPKKAPFGMPSMPISVNALLRVVGDKKRAIDGAKVCELEKEAGVQAHFLTDLGVPFLVAGEQFVAYENARSVQMKTTWASLNQLGGLALFDVQLDDVDGRCPDKQPFPLLNTIAATQVCETCVRTPKEAIPCDDDVFTVSCSYRLPVGNKQTMPEDKIPFDYCNQIVIEDVALQADGAIHFRDDAARRAMRNVVNIRQRAGTKRLIASVKCEMSMSELESVIDNGPATVKSILEFVGEFELSGVELACDHLINANTKDAFSAFLSGLRANLATAAPVRKCPLVLSLRMQNARRNLAEAYDLLQLNVLHHVVLAPFSEPVGENITHIDSPLFPAHGHSNDIATTVQAWTRAGLDKARIVLQIPAYATVQAILSNVAAIGEKAGRARVIDQAQACSELIGAESHMMWDRIAAYAITARGQWLSMQNQETIAYKIYYAIREGLGGMSLLALNEDDWQGVCGSGRFPLLTAAAARCRAQQ